MTLVSNTSWELQLKLLGFLQFDDLYVAFVS